MAFHSDESYNIRDTLDTLPVFAHALLKMAKVIPNAKKA